jgi:rSAM/selenodomain-associated transferase 1
MQQPGISPVFTLERVLVFARAPVPGEVKRRLIPFLGARAAAALYRRIAEHCLMTAASSFPARVEFWCTPDCRHPFFLACRRRYRVRLRVQQGADLGVRMRDALGKRLPALLMGSDCPSLTGADLRAAWRALKEGADAVLGPARDGGYVLLGLSRPAPGLFRSMPWGTDAVLEETRARLRRAGFVWHELPLQWDVDRPEDLSDLEALFRNGGSLLGRGRSSGGWSADGGEL